MGKLFSVLICPIYETCIAKSKESCTTCLKILTHKGVQEELKTIDKNEWDFM